MSGLYLRVRNPMYVGVVSAILGQALLFGSGAVAGYGALVFLTFHVFVLLYEEPVLLRQFGANTRPTSPRCRAGCRGSALSLLRERPAARVDEHVVPVPDLDRCAPTPVEGGEDRRVGRHVHLALAGLRGGFSISR